jgi:hypothetical protein
MLPFLGLYNNVRPTVEPLHFTFHSHELYLANTSSQFQNVLIVLAAEVMKNTNTNSRTSDPERTCSALLTNADIYKSVCVVSSNS